MHLKSPCHFIEVVSKFHLLLLNHLRRGTSAVAPMKHPTSEDIPQSMTQVYSTNRDNYRLSRATVSVKSVNHFCDHQFVTLCPTYTTQPDHSRAHPTSTGDPATTNPPRSIPMPKISKRNSGENREAESRNPASHIKQRQRERTK